MTTPPPEEITQWLHDWSLGDDDASAKLLPVIYGELRRMAKRYMAREAADHTLQTTALIHEAYLNLAAQRDKQWENRSHFFAVAAQAMRHILVDYARARRRDKRGGDASFIALDEAPLVSLERSAEMIALDDALTALAAIDPRKCRMVELRFFGGLTEEETATVMQVSLATVKRDWRAAKLWLARELNAKEVVDNASDALKQ